MNLKKLRMAVDRPAQWMRGTCVAKWFRAAGQWYQNNLFVAQIISIVAYRLVLDVVYVRQMSPLYAYSGFTTHLSPVTYAASFFALLAFAPFVAELGTQRDASSLLVTFINYLYFIPLTSYIGCYGDASVIFICAAFAYWLLLLFWQYRLPRICFDPLQRKHSRVTWIALSVASAALVMFVSGRYAHFRLFFEFLDVYGVRAEAASYSMPRLVTYTFSIMTMSLSVAILYWLRKKRILVAILLLVVYFFYYSIAAHKSVFFFLLLVLASFYLYREWVRNYLPVELTIGCAATGLLSRLGNSIFMSFFFRRFMYVPVQLSREYFDYFQTRPLNLMRNGLMGKLSFGSIYGLNVSQLIGEYDGTGSSANNGLIGDMAANLPIMLGLMLMPLVLIVVFRLLDAVTDRLDAKIFFPFCVFFAVTFNNSSWSTTLISHGYLFACLLLYLFPREEKMLNGSHI